ncbi:unnamed protein product [Coregonus sp. 'balchen']|nr:unnamed protein product [Coregonus sp. 'balchen']
MQEAGSVSRLVRPQTDELGDFLTGIIDSQQPLEDELGDFLTGIIDSQQPLEGIPDDDNLDSSDGGPFQSSFGRTHSFNMCHPRLQGISARREDCVTNQGRRTKTKRLSMHEKLAMEFHERKLMYLKEEHVMKMQILHVELAMA